MDLTPPVSWFEQAYRDGDPPWVIDEPQSAVVALARDGAVTGTVLYPGCGTGEHTILLAGLGYDVLGADAAPTAVHRARERAAAAEVDARFVVADALAPDASARSTRWSTVPCSTCSTPLTRPATPAHSPGSCAGEASCTCSPWPGPALPPSSAR